MTPKSGGGWKVSGGSRSKEYRTQAEAEHAARSELLARGGGELVVKARNGKVRDKTTVGKAEAHKSAEPHKGADTTAEGHSSSAPDKDEG